MSDFEPLSAHRSIAGFMATLLYTEPGSEPSPAAEERFRQDHHLLGEIDRLLARTAEAQKLEALAAVGPAIRESLERERQGWDAASEPHPEARAMSEMQRHGGGGLVIPEIRPAVSEIPTQLLSRAIDSLERQYYGAWLGPESGGDVLAKLDVHFREPQERWARARGLPAAAI